MNFTGQGTRSVLEKERRRMVEEVPIKDQQRIGAMKGEYNADLQGPSTKAQSQRELDVLRQDGTMTSQGSWR